MCTKFLYKITKQQDKKRHKILTMAFLSLQQIFKEEQRVS